MALTGGARALPLRHHSHGSHVHDINIKSAGVLQTFMRLRMNLCIEHQQSCLCTCVCIVEFLVRPNHAVIVACQSRSLHLKSLEVPVIIASCGHPMGVL